MQEIEVVLCLSSDGSMRIDWEATESRWHATDGMIWDTEKMEWYNGPEPMWFDDALAKLADHTIKETK